MKKRTQLIILLGLVLLTGGTTAMKAQQWTLKTNVLSWATTTANVAAEVKIAPRWTAELGVAYKPWSLLSDNRKVMGVMVQPEVRYWLCQPFYEHFVGFHLHYANYNGGLDKYRYQGSLMGAGFSYGYQWIIGRNWNLELNGGLGYARMNHDKYLRPKCGFFVGEESRNYFGITKLSVSLVYILKN